MGFPLLNTVRRNLARGWDENSSRPPVTELLHNSRVDSPGSRLKALRKARKLKLREVAEGSGVPVSTLSDLENERSGVPAGDTLSKLAAFYEVQSHWIVTGDGPKHTVASKGDKETELLMYYRALSQEGQQYLLARARDMLSDEHGPRTQTPGDFRRRESDDPIQ
jgi:transcriptional regulator with XRE-family HTH domain